MAHFFGRLQYALKMGVLSGRIGTLMSWRRGSSSVGSEGQFLVLEMLLLGFSVNYYSVQIEKGNLPMCYLYTLFIYDTKIYEALVMPKL